MSAPAVRIFDTLTPTNAAAGDFELQYDTLGSQLDELSRTNTQRAREVWHAHEGSVEEENAARQLASEYFAHTAGKLILANDSEKRNLWAGRYNEAAAELYERPDRNVVIELMDRERREIRAALDTGTLRNSPAVGIILGTYDRLLPADAAAETDTISEAETRKVTEAYKEELLNRYGYVFDLIEQSGKTQFEPDDLKDLFEDALRVLDERGEPGWNEWKVVMKDSRILSVNPRERTIEIGKKRAKAGTKKVRELLAHELFVHGLRANNSFLTNDKALIDGLPGYNDVEEGLGKFAEHAVSGSKPPTSADHYVDIGLALGIVNGTQLNRHEVYEMAIARKLVRAEMSGTYDKNILSKLLRETAASVDRIFYGAPGDIMDAKQAVFIKETAYYGGYRKVLEYVVKAQREGKIMKEIFDFVNSGRFDPSNAEHIRYMQERKHG